LAAIVFGGGRTNWRLSIGIEPDPDRKRTTIEVWTKSGLVTYYLLFAMRLATRRVCFLGCMPTPGGSWMAQMARNLTDAFGRGYPPPRCLTDTKPFGRVFH
jgi:hypothetical protein